MVQFFLLFEMFKPDLPSQEKTTGRETSVGHVEGTKIHRGGEKEKIKGRVYSAHGLGDK